MTLALATRACLSFKLKNQYDSQIIDKGCIHNSCISHILDWLSSTPSAKHRYLPASFSSHSNQGATSNVCPTPTSLESPLRLRCIRVMKMLVDIILRPYRARPAIGLPIGSGTIVVILEIKRDMCRHGCKLSQSQTTLPSKTSSRYSSTTCMSRKYPDGKSMRFFIVQCWICSRRYFRMV